MPGTSCQGFGKSYRRYHSHPGYVKLLTLTPSSEAVAQQFETNFWGAMRMTNAVLPHLRAKGAGTIIFMSSIAGWLGAAAGGPYSASKFALEGDS